MIVNIVFIKKLKKSLEKLLNDEEYNYFTISGNQALMNRNKNDYIEEVAKRPLNDKEYKKYCFMSSSKYHYIAATNQMLY